MPANAFMRFEKIDGSTAVTESLQKDYPGKDGWMPIDEFSWKGEHPQSIHNGGGGSLGVPKANEISVSCAYEKSSPMVMQSIVVGDHFKSVTINLLKQVGASDPMLYFQLYLREAYISKVTTKSADDGTVKLDIELVFRQIGIGYKRQNNDGKLDMPVYFRWNIAAGNQQSNDIQFSIH